MEVEYVWQDSFQGELNSALKEELRQAALSGVQATLEEALRAELDEHLGFERYARQGESGKAPEAQRSGYFKRQVETEHGTILELRVPKLRRGNKEREWQILTRYQRCLQHVLDSLLYVYVLGLSLRDLQEGMYVLFGSMLSVSAINRITLAAQERLAKLQQAPIVEMPPILVVDGVWVKVLYSDDTTWVDKAGHVRNQRRVEERVILAALAVWPEGRYHLLHYQVAQEESEDSWQDFLARIMARGVDPQAVKLVVSDGTKGLLAAMQQHLPQARLQRCTVHKIRGFKRYLRYDRLPETNPETGQPLSAEQAKSQRRAEICSDAHHIFDTHSEPEARQRLASFNQKWAELEPGAVKNFNWGVNRCFEFYQFDPALHALIHSTNLIERLFREFRAKADEIGSFPNQISCLTLFHLVMARDHAKHQRLVFANT